MLISLFVNVSDNVYGEFSRDDNPYAYSYFIIRMAVGNILILFFRLISVRNVRVVLLLRMID